MSTDREAGFVEVGERKPVEMGESAVVSFVEQIKSYFGLSRKRVEPVNSRESFANFLETRASFIAQTSLYGYIRTRAGMRYPELFDDDPFVVSINIAKWHVWLACLADFAEYAGRTLVRSASAADAERVGQFVRAVVDGILDAKGCPEEAGEAFPAQVEKVRERLAECDWALQCEDEVCFSVSPDALVEWAPIVEELKKLDADIVRNSVRFRWQEVRRDFRKSLDADAVLSEV